MADYEVNLESLLGEMQIEWIWKKSGQNLNSKELLNQKLISDKVGRTLLSVSESSERGESAIILAARCNLPKETFAPWVSHTTTTLAHDVISMCDSTELESTLIHQIELGLTKLRGLKLQTSIDRGGRKTSHKLKVLGKLVGKSMSNSQDKMTEFKRTNVTDLGILYTLIQLGRIELNWRFIFPYLLPFFDDIDFYVRREACLCLIEICDQLKDTQGDNIIIKSQTESILRDSIIPLILSLPSLTPVDESIDLVDISYNALLKLLETNFKNELEFNLQLSSVLNDYILPSMSKVQDNPEILIVILSKLEMVIQLAGPYLLVLSKQIIFTILSTLMDPYIIHSNDAVLKLLKILSICLSVNTGDRLEEYKFNVLGCLGVVLRRTDDPEVIARITEQKLVL